MIVNDLIIKEKAYKDGNNINVTLINVKSVGSSSFYNSNISNLILNEGLKQINIYAFKNNNISSLKLPSSLKYIGLRAFHNNKIKEIFIPDSVKFIGYQAFDDDVDVIYNNRKYESNILKKIGIHNLIKLNEMVNLVPDINLNNMTKEAVIELPMDKDSIKSYIRNYKRFNHIKNKFNNEMEYDNKNLFKLCFMFGMFNLDNDSYENIKKIIIDLYYSNSLDIINNIVSDIKLEKFNLNFCKFIINNYKDPNFIMIFKKYYLEYEKINKVIKKIKENEISTLNTKYKKSNDLKEKVYLKEKINELKENGKKIELEDILNYINNHLYDCRESCKELESVLLMLSCYLTKDEFENIQDFYEKVKSINYKINLYSYKENNNDIMTYEWLDNKDPINLVLGYICNCCSKYKSNGEDIMLQSMINPNIKTLVVRDNDNEIIAKATAYFNKEKNYLIFNTIEVKRIIPKEKHNDILNSILKGIYKQIELLNNDGYNINDVRIGLKNNDLYDILINNYEVVVKDMLNNYNYSNYESDSNDVEFGQAIIPLYNRKKGKK